MNMLKGHIFADKHQMRVAYNERVEDFGGRVMNILSEYHHGNNITAHAGSEKRALHFLTNIIKTAQDLDLQRWEKG
jgi:hypothetical protein|tara:strand:+ start:1133 stop:1360 length:228 start_codon:yes stop_codon:yes gene_type:complete